MFATASYRSSDPDEFTQLISNSRIEVVQAQRGTFSAYLTQVRLGKLGMTRAGESCARSFHIVIPADRVALEFLPSPQPAMTVLSAQVGYGDLLLFAPDFAGCERTDAPCDWATVSLPVEEFRRYGISLTGRDLMPRDTQQVLRLRDAELANLSRLHRETFDYAETMPKVLADPEAARAAQQHLISAAFAAIAGGTDQRSAYAHHRQRIMARFEALIEANRDRTLYMAEVCEAVGATERTFRNLTYDSLGMSPTRYPCLRRMRQAHRALRLANEVTATVTEVATRHGFFHLGRFAVAYRELFGESPSETLRQPADSRPAHN